MATAAIAWPVLLAPNEQIFGHEIVGRHHDPFTVMRQMAGAGPAGPFIQPVTDGAGWLLARLVNPVAAYNILVLSTFPLTAAATYLLGRYCRASHGGAFVAALLFAFAPLHLAHAAYHPHIAQTQWLPLYVLALFAAVDRPGPLRFVGLVAAAAALVLSNFYGGFMVAVISPALLVAYWWTSARKPPVGHLWIASGVLATCAVTGLAAAIIWFRTTGTSIADFAVPASDVATYSARWWAYGVPSVSHAVFGPASADILGDAGITTGLLEQQVFVSYASLALALTAGVLALRAWRSDRSRRPVVALFAMVIVAAAASFAPGPGGCQAQPWTPACHLHAAAPMFRAFARFAFVVHLGVAVSAGLAVTWLMHRGRVGKGMAVALVALACLEYWPLPARARDVLPTSAHRWLVRKTDARTHTLDCTSFDLGDVHLPWLMQQRVSFLGPDVTTCRDPHLGAQAAARGHTHVLVRGTDRTGAAEFLGGSPAGMRRVGTFSDAVLYEVAADQPSLIEMSSRGFYGYERDDDDVWRWMSGSGEWRVRNASDRPMAVRLSADLDAAARSRSLAVSIDDGPPQTVAITAAASYTLGRWLLAPGDHIVRFATSEPPFRPADDGRSTDDRRLTIAFRNVQWIEERTLDERPR